MSCATAIADDNDKTNKSIHFFLVGPNKSTPQLVDTRCDAPCYTYFVRVLPQERWFLVQVAINFHKHTAKHCSIQHKECCNCQKHCHHGSPPTMRVNTGTRQEWRKKEKVGGGQMSLKAYFEHSFLESEPKRRKRRRKAAPVGLPLFRWPRLFAHRGDEKVTATRFVASHPA